MAENSKIEWTTHTFNPWRGCTKVSAGCQHCYADTLSKRNPGTLGVWGPNGTRVVAAESTWKEPLKWNRLAAWCGNPVCKEDVAGRINGVCACGLRVERPRVVCASLADVFEGPETMPAESVPTIVAARHRLLDLISRTPALDWLLLTKRPQNITRLWDEAARHREGEENGPPLAMPLPNVWLGTSVENQAAADERIPHLLRAPAAVRFLSCEPLLGPVTLPLNSVVAGHPAWKGDPNAPDVAKPMLHWVIVGGESGPGARPMHPAWPRSLRDQCQAVGVAFFFKQFGEWMPGTIGGGCDRDVRVMYHDGRVCKPTGDAYLDVSMPKSMRPNPDAGAHLISRVGKKAAGRELDGRTWDEFPQSAEAK